MMVEFTEREKIIIKIVSYLNHPVMKQYPLDMKFNVVYGVLKTTTNNFKMSIDDVKDMVYGINKEQEDAVKEAINKMGSD